MQFRLRSLFVVTAGIGVYCGVVFALPPAASLVAVALQGLVVVGSRWLHSPRAGQEAPGSAERYTVLHRRIALDDALGASQAMGREAPDA